MNPAFFQLGVNFSVERLQQDLLLCEKDTWRSHFNSQDYSGEWNSISLRSVSGASHDIRSLPNNSYKNTPLLDECLYFQEAISWFQCEKEAIRLLNLMPNSEIKEHSDPDLAYEDGFFRIHIPIRTNAQVLFYVNKTLVPMQMGECWYANFRLPHRVENNSAEPRVHLVIDCIRNSWSDELFANAGFDLNAKNNSMTDEVRKQVIAELLRNPTETNLKLVERLQTK